MAKKERERENGPKKVPHTIESLRVKDETTVEDVNAEEHELVRNDFDNDEFSEYYQQSYEPKVLITYADNPMRVFVVFCTAKIYVNLAENANIWKRAD